MQMNVPKKNAMKALFELSEYAERGREYHGARGQSIDTYVDERVTLLADIICDYFSNPPLEWEEIQELKKGDIIWDNLNKKNLKINFIEVSRWGEKIIDGWLEGDIMSLVYLFEPNRFYRKEVQE